MIASIRQGLLGGHGLILLAALLGGTCATAQAFSPPGYDPRVISTLRLLVGGSALLYLAVRNRELGSFHQWKVAPTLLAALFIAGFQLCFFSAVAKTGAAVGSVVAIGSAPVIAGLLGRIFRGERLSQAWCLATLLAVCGCTLLCLASGEINIDPVGIILALGAALSYAAYALIIKGMLGEISPNGIMAVIICLAALLSSPSLINLDPEWLLQPAAIAVILHLGLITMAFGYWIYAIGLQTVNVSTATTLTLADPLTSALLGVVVLGEQLSGQALTGIGLIFAGLIILVTKKETNRT